MARHKKDEKKVTDTISPRGRGRPTKVRASELRGRADNYRWILNGVWERLWPLLSKSKSEEEVVRAFQEGSSPYDREFVPAFAALALETLREPTFPRQRKKAQVNFLADSLAGLGAVTPRRSRDICAAERSKEKEAHHILRYEYYVECSCGYQGPSRDHGCPSCGAKIQVGIYGALLGPVSH
jgi:hypothetical protein